MTRRTRLLLTDCRHGNRNDRASRSNRLSLALLLISAACVLCHGLAFAELPWAGTCDERAVALHATGGDEVALDRLVSGTSSLRLAGIDPPEDPQP